MDSVGCVASSDGGWGAGVEGGLTADLDSGLAGSEAGWGFGAWKDEFPPWTWCGWTFEDVMIRP